MNEASSPAPPTLLKAAWKEIEDTTKKGSNKIAPNGYVSKDQENTIGADTGRELLSMLRSFPKETPWADSGAVSMKEELKILSTDEFLLGELEAREDRERGADLLNTETFGEHAGAGWSFEENLAANQRLQYQKVRSAPTRVAASMWKSTPGLARHLRESLLQFGKEADVKPTRMKQVLNYVFQKGWDDITWRSNYTALHLAAELGCSEVMPLLVFLGADTGTKDLKGRTARKVAWQRKNASCVEMLQVMETCQLFQDSVGELPAILKASADFVESAIRKKALHEPEPEPRGFVGLVALVSQMKESDRLKFALFETAKLLHLEPPCFDALFCLSISHGVWVGYSKIVLHMLVQYGRDDLIPLAIALGADYFQMDSWGRTAFDCAMQLNRESSLVALNAALNTDIEDRHAAMNTAMNEYFEYPWIDPWQTHSAYN
jgi:hypothetical protein